MAKKKAAPSHAGQLLFERLFHLLETLGQISDRLPWYNLTNSNAARFVLGGVVKTSVSHPESNVTVSSRTPEGMPSECPLCGAKTNIEFSDPAQDAPCPNCGHLLWASSQLIHAVTQRYADALGTSPGAINADTRFSDLGADSLDTVEIVMDLEEEYDISIPEDVAERIHTFGDAVRYIQDQQRGTGG